MSKSSLLSLGLCCGLVMLATQTLWADPDGSSGEKPKPAMPVAPEDPASPVHPRRFGFPGGVGPTRGWYVWRNFDPDTWTAEVSNESSGAKYTVRVLPWATTYRHLVYGAHPDELLPGERVNLFFAPDEKQQRGYLVHFQDELGQMKGHGHVWEVQSVTAEGQQFTARVLAGDKPLDDKILTFQLAPRSRHWREGRLVEQPALKQGDRLYLTWAYRDEQRLVHLTADAASLDALQKAERTAVEERLAAEGLGALVEAVEEETAHLLVFPTYWAQVAGWKEGQTVEVRATTGDLRPTGPAVAARVLSRKNLGTYGSGATELAVRLDQTDDAQRIRSWVGGKVVRVRVK